MVAVPADVFQFCKRLQPAVGDRIAIIVYTLQGQDLPLEEKYQFFVSDMAEKFCAFATAILPEEVKKTIKINIEEY